MKIMKQERLNKSLLKHELYRSKNVAPIEPKEKDYLRDTRKEREATIKKIQLITSNISPKRRTPTDSPRSKKGKTVFINGREVILRSNFSTSGNNSLCQIFNKLNREKQRLKDQEKDQSLLREINTSFDAFQEWITHQK